MAGRALLRQAAGLRGAAPDYGRGCAQLRRNAGLRRARALLERLSVCAGLRRAERDGVWAQNVGLEGNHAAAGLRELVGLCRLPDCVDCGSCRTAALLHSCRELRVCGDCSGLRATAEVTGVVRAAAAARLLHHCRSCGTAEAASLRKLRRLRKGLRSCRGCESSAGCACSQTARNARGLGRGQGAGGGR